ncbi:MULTISPECIES: DUF3499 domain-containing protein [Propionimicrobium]|uniref:DUF3499 domain-containing protein n=1 Tax=Propionimicrobium lymphophilum ACS-093-V-SCH5 TaxID=883161 RepID=S2W166_9ACTN|nr:MULTISPECIES: DUF3499 domain-containing protein [Propionimicrobium]EPD32105.1 hypothetical protein HMPREF9306_01669 [Propionimicrobium lymphophilum ACS-093-V-SCH5]
MKRHCCRSACDQPAVATLTYVYADSMAVLGPLASEAEPGCYDLCAEHSKNLSAPRGWQVLRLTEPGYPAPEPDEDDLMALANAVREVGFSDFPEGASQSHPYGTDEHQTSDKGEVVELARRGHLRMIADASKITDRLG